MPSIRLLSVAILCISIAFLADNYHQDTRKFECQMVMVTGKHTRNVTLDDSGFFSMDKPVLVVTRKGLSFDIEIDNSDELNLYDLVKEGDYISYCTGKGFNDRKIFELKNI